MSTPARATPVQMLHRHPIFPESYYFADLCTCTTTCQQTTATASKRSPSDVNWLNDLIATKYKFTPKLTKINSHTSWNHHRKKSHSNRSKAGTAATSFTASIASRLTTMNPAQIAGGCEQVVDILDPAGPERPGPPANQRRQRPQSRFRPDAARPRSAQDRRGPPAPARQLPRPGHRADLFVHLDHRSLRIRAHARAIRQAAGRRRRTARQPRPTRPSSRPTKAAK